MDYKVQHLKCCSTCKHSDYYYPKSEYSCTKYKVEQEIEMTVSGKKIKHILNLKVDAFDICEDYVGENYR